ncbi:MAG: hypothetical protein V7L13_07420 [Nostoc sp.]|uniref:TRAFAC clade GTPase domain-containing protein n=1 Tax=Nostoc sp. TaxID=1180 RepID=UPI002FF49A8C
MTEIRIIGPRGSGKTTYLASLAAFPHKELFPGLEIIPIGPDAENLAGMAEDILKQGARLPPTRKGQRAFYKFQIKLPSSEKIELVAVDYAGEIFEDIALAHKWDDVEKYVQDLFQVQGCMVMLTDWQPEQDMRLYKPVFTKLWQEMSAEAKNQSAKIRLRIAVVMAKCERGEIWPGRLDAGEDLFKVRLPQTYQFLTSKFSPQTLKFFACSSFGVLGDKNPRPNRYIPNDGTSFDNAYLFEASVWQPHGLIAPIYWLSTGRMLRDHRL